LCRPLFPLVRMNHLLAFFTYFLARAILSVALAPVSDQQRTFARLLREPDSISKQQASRLSSVRASSDDILPTIRQGVVESGAAEEWDKSIRFLSGMLPSGNDAEAEMLLATALEWKAWALTSEEFREFKRPLRPNSKKLEDALMWLKGEPLQLDDEQILNVIKQHPKLYLTDPELNYRKVTGVAPEQYRHPGALKALVLEDPSVLKYTTNCVDEGCQAECGNCWVSRQMR